MEQFKIFSSGAELVDSEQDDQQINNKHIASRFQSGNKKLHNKSKRLGSQLRSGSRNIDYNPNKSQGRMFSNSSRKPNNPMKTLSNVTKSYMSNTNTLDAKIRAKKELEKMKIVSSDEKAGNENQQINNAAWVDDKPQQEDYKQNIAYNKKQCMDIDNGINETMARLESAQQKIKYKEKLNQHKETLEDVMEENYHQEEVIQDKTSGIKNTKKVLNFDYSKFYLLSSKL